MSIFAAKLIAITLTIIMFCFDLNPLGFAGFYIVFRPSVQPFAYHHYPLWGNIPITSLFAVSLVLYAIIDSVRNGFKFISGNILPLYLLCFFSVFSLYKSPDLNLSLGHMLKILTAVAMYLLIYNNISSVKDVKKILTCYFLSAIIPLLYGFYQYVTKTAHAWENGPGGTRIDSVLGECNAYGEYLAVLICILLVGFFFKKLRYKKWLLVILSLATLLSFLLSLNRGSWISLFVGIIVAAIWYRRHVKATLIVSILTLIVLAASPVIIVRFSELTQKTEFGSHNTFAGRLQYGERLLDLVKKNPIVGYGLGTAGNTTIISYPPHNDYLRLALEIGIPGALFYIMFLFKELLDHIKRVKTKMFGAVHFSAFALVIYFIILSFFQNIIYNVTVFPMILGLFAISAKLHFLEKFEKIQVSE